MESWQILLGVLFVGIVLLVGMSLDRTSTRTVGPTGGRGWDRFDPTQKLAVVLLAVILIAALITRCVA